jgi:iron complex outermembrane receptor protein
MKNVNMRAVLMGGAAAAGFVAPALAQERDEIIVTARQRAESVQDVPATVTVLPTVTLDRAGVERPEDFIFLTPGVTIVDAAEVGDTQINIRGINGARDAETSFAFILDGVLLTNPSSFNREFGELQQIEILKGPQGALYGRNAAAGAMIVTTKKPGDEFEGQAKFSYANHQSYFASAYVSGPLIKDALYASLAGDFRETDGFYRNTFLGANNVDDFENFNIRGRVLWEPAEGTSLDTKVRYGEVDAAAISFNAVFQLPDLAAAFMVPQIFEDPNERTFVFQPNIDPDNNQEALEISTKLDHETPIGTLTAWALYSDIKQDFLADGTSAAFGFFNPEPSCRATTAGLNAAGVQLPPPQFIGMVPEPAFLVPGGSFFGPYTPTTCDGYQFQVRNQEDFSFEVRLTSPSDQALRWLVGGYYLDIDRQVGVATIVDDGTAPIASLINPRTDQLLYDDFDSRVIAGFGQLAYDVTPDFEVAFAGRFDSERRRVNNLVPTTQLTNFIDFNPVDGNGDFNPFNDGGSPLNPGLDPTLNPGGIVPAEETFSQFQPKVSLSWDATDDLALFANWGIGFKSGGFNNQGSQATINFFINGFAGTNVLINDQFDKEKSSAFEAGFKWRGLDGRLSIDGAGYYTSVDDMQFFEFFVGSFGLLRVVSNIDEVDIYGGELSVTFKPTDNLSLFAAGNVTESEIKANTSRPETVGNKSPYTPDYTLNFGGELALPVLGGKGDFVARVDYGIVGPTWFHTVQDETRPTVFEPLLPGLGTADYSISQRDAYGVLNIRAGFENERLAVTGFVRNLTNKQVIEEIIPAPEFGGLFVQPGALRLYGAEIKVKF